ncbi:hypothetical protein C8J57DRAFT_1525442 [Mycena rebaudengoi]|nr:hypothetical protein C8J57DRAFT_1525442 [Mycena rebaudengoi]
MAPGAATLCTECGHSYTCSWDYHKWTHQKQVLLTFPAGDTETVSRNPDLGEFHCSWCSASHKDPSNMMKHSRLCYHTGNTATPLDVDLPGTVSVGGTSPSPHVHPANAPPLAVLSSDAPEAPLTVELDEDDNSPIDLAVYCCCEPDYNTVVDHVDYNLPACGLVVRTDFHLLLCIICGRVVPLDTLAAHVHSHVPGVNVPNSMGPQLRAKFQLIEVTNITYPVTTIPPIFPLELVPKLFYFCGGCGRGYGGLDTLHSHQRDPTRCPQSSAVECRKFSYPRLLPLKPSVLLPPTPELVQGLHMHFDYTKMPIALPPCLADLNLLVHREQWVQHFEGFMTDEISDACCLSKAGDYLHKMKEAVVEWLKAVETSIKRYNTFGVLKDLSQFGPMESQAALRTLTPDSFRLYGTYLWTLIFNLIWQIREEQTVYAYPITPMQRTTLMALADAGSRSWTQKKMGPLVQAVVLALFTHHKDNSTDEYDKGKFSSAVNCFIILTAFKPDGQMHPTSTITSQLMKLVYVNRAAQLFEMKRLRRSQGINVYEALENVKQNLIDRRETPMAFLFNMYNLVCSLKCDQFTQDVAHFVDAGFRELSYLGKRIRLGDFGTLVDGLRVDIRSVIAEYMLFGREKPVGLDIVFELSNLVDNPSNKTAGYCLLDHPSNPFTAHCTSYAEFILADPELAERFTFKNQGAIVWKIDSCLQFLLNKEKIQEKLLVLMIVSAGPCTRGTDIAAESLHNVPGCSERCAVMLYSNFCLVGITDKTTHMHLKDKYAPHAPSKSVGWELLYFLGIIRPFQTFLANYFWGPTTAHRYHEYLWPKVKANITSAELRILMTFGSAHAHGNAYLTEISKEYFWDAAEHHTTSTADSRYNKVQNVPVHANRRKVLGCIMVSGLWQSIVPIKKENPLNVHQNEVIPDEPMSSIPGILNSFLIGLQYIQAQDSLETDKAVSLNVPLLANTLMGFLRPKVTKMIVPEIGKNMAYYAARLHPHPPVVYGPHTLAAKSTIQVHPSRLDDLCRLLHDDTAFFRYPEQALFIEKIEAQEGDVLAIMCCSTGKTMLGLMIAKAYSWGRVVSSHFAQPTNRHRIAINYHPTPAVFPIPPLSQIHRYRSSVPPNTHHHVIPGPYLPYATIEQ